MSPARHRIALGLMLIFGLLATGWAMEADDLQRLKAAGISEKTIALMVKHRSLETVALTVEEVLDLKQAGFSEETIAVLVQSSAFSDTHRDRVYGRSLRSISVASIDDLLALKAAGLSDTTLQALIIYHSDNSPNADRERAWRFLHQMGFIIRLPDTEATIASPTP